MDGWMGEEILVVVGLGGSTKVSKLGDGWMQHGNGIR